MKSHGTYFEAGALDGNILSKSWYLDHALGWTGMLAEMVPHNIPLLKDSGRHAAIAPVCVSPDPWPQKVIVYPKWKQQTMYVINCSENVNGLVPIFN